MITTYLLITLTHAYSNIHLLKMKYEMRLLTFIFSFIASSIANEAECAESLQGYASLRYHTWSSNPVAHIAYFGAYNRRHCYHGMDPQNFPRFG